jgi:hypothetical protein
LSFIRKVSTSMRALECALLVLVLPCEWQHHVDCAAACAGVSMAVAALVVVVCLVIPPTYDSKHRCCVCHGLQHSLTSTLA